MTTVSLPIRLLGRKIEIGLGATFFVKNVLFGHLGRGFCPPLPLPGHTYDRDFIKLVDFLCATMYTHQ